MLGKPFGRREDSGEHGMQVEFLDNCLVQVEELRKRVGPGFAHEQQAIWPQVWNHDEQADELQRKIALAGSFAAEIDGVVRGSKAASKTIWDVLETLQGVIDNCEQSLASIMASLLERQRAESIRAQG